ncbi:MAG TPA: hypothetical protein VF834_15725, partial [Streptosporangiaceae bacterium]
MKAVSALITKLPTTIRAQIRRNPRTGRHQAPSKIKKTYLRAGIVAVAVAAVAGIAAIPLTSSLASAAPSASIRQAAHQAGTSNRRSSHSRPAKKSSGRGNASAASHGARLAHASGKKAAQPKANTQSAAKKPRVAAMRCTGTSGMLPQNYGTIV